MKYHHYTAFFILSFFVCVSLQAQNGWTKTAKGFYGQAVAAHFSSSDYYSTTGQLFDAGSTFKNSGILLYGEYGITDRLTSIIDVPILMLNRFSSTEVVAGLGSIKLGLKYRLLKNIPIAIQVDADIPTDDGINFSNVKNPNSLGIIEQINLPTSDGEFNVWTTLVASQSSTNGKIFGSIYGSINFRSQSFSNQIQVGGEVGYLFFEKLYLIGKLKIQEQLSSENPSTNVSFLYGEGTTFTSLSITAMYNLTENLKLVSSYSNYSGVIVNRKNIYDGPTISIGVAVDY